MRTCTTQSGGLPIDTRYGAGAELLLRITIIAIEGRADGIGVSELRRLLGYPRDALDRMAEIDFVELVEDSGPYIGAALLIARDPQLARKYAERLQEAVENMRSTLGLPTAFAPRRLTDTTTEHS